MCETSSDHTFRKAILLGTVVPLGTGITAKLSPIEKGLNTEVLKLSNCQ